MKKYIIYSIAVLIHITLLSQESPETYTTLDNSVIHYHLQQASTHTILSVQYIEQSTMHPSNDVMLQNILSCAFLRNCSSIEIPRSTLANPLICIPLNLINKAKITFKYPNYPYTIIAYSQANIAFKNDLHYYDDEIKDSELQDIVQYKDELLYRIFMVNHKNKIIGGIKLVHDWNKKEATIIDYLYVAAAYRHNHIGTKLVETAKELSQAHNKNIVRLLAVPYADSEMTEDILHQWYQKRGFKRETKSPWFFAETFPHNSIQEKVTLEFN